MTKEEAAAWVRSLKPGDIVIRRRYNDMWPDVVKKVTPTGIVRTIEGYSFKPSYGGLVSGYGNSGAGEIVPETDELLSIIDKRKVVSKAKYFMHNVREVNYEFAKDLLELCEQHGIDT